MGWIIFGIIATVIVAIVIIAIVVSNKSGGGSSSRHSDHFISTSHTSMTPVGSILTPEEIKGEWAENRIAKLLNKISSEIPDSYVINNVTIPSGRDRNGNNRTTEIDHILFTKSGLFVIETKSRTGTIYGNEEDDDWSQTLGKYDEIEHTFFNPVKQNDIHIRVLRRLLRIDDLICFSCIVFEDGDISNVESDLVIYPDDLEDFILDLLGEEAYNSQYVLNLYTRIKYYKDHPPKTKEEHIREVHENHKFDA